MKQPTKTKPKEYEQQIYDLASALLLLANWYEVDTGPVEPLDRVREYLATFPIGQGILQEDAENMLSTTLLPKEKVWTP